jgi:hypothetical protein
MKKEVILLFLILATILFLIGVEVSQAQPNLVCDASPGITSYKITGSVGNTWIPTADVPAQPDGSLKFDVAQAPVGSNTITLSPCITDPIWGRSCQTPVNFTFPRPSAPAIIKNIRLIP